jgi:hypothetical protein
MSEPTRALVSLTLVALLPLAPGCALFGANLPPGRAGGTFVEEPVGLPSFSDAMLDARNTYDGHMRRHLAAEVEVLRSLVVSSTALREQLQSRKKIFLSAWEKNDEVSTLDAELVLEGAHWLIELDLLLYGLWTQYRRYLPYGSEPDPYAPAQGASVLSTETRIKGGLIALVAAMVRMDNARVVVELTGGELALTQWLNRGDTSRGIPPESFDRIIGGYLDPDHREHLQVQLFALEENRPRVLAVAEQDVDVDFLLTLLAESEVARDVVDEGPLGRGIRFTMAVVGRSFATLLTPVLDAYIAAAFADPSDFAPRTTLRLVTVPGMAENIDATLQPLDVLLVERTRLGDPVRGYTQAFVFLGDARTIRAHVGPTHHVVVGHAAAFRHGRVFLTLDDQGAALVTLDEVLNAEGVAVLRVGTRKASVMPTEEAVVDDETPWPIDDDSAPIEIVESDDERSKGEVGDDERRAGELTGDDARAESSLVADVDVLTSHVDEAETLRNALEVLVTPRFVTPTLLSKREHAARLLWATFGTQSGAAPTPGRNEPTFARLVDAIVNEGYGEIVLVTEAGAIVDESARRETFAQRREGVDERGFVLPTRLPTLDEIPLPPGPRDPSAPQR